MTITDIFKAKIEFILSHFPEGRIKEILLKDILRSELINGDSKYWIWEINVLDELIYVSPNVKSVLSFYPEEMLSKKIYDFLQNDDRDLFLLEYSDFKKNNVPKFYIKCIFECKDKKFVILENYGFKLINEDNNFSGYCGISIIPKD